MKANHVNGSYSLMRLKISGDGEQTISVSQVDERCFNRHSEYDYSNCRMIIYKIEEDAEALQDIKLSYVQGVSGWDRETHAMFENLEKGDYYVYVEIDWNANTEDTEFCVTCYGATRTFFLRDEKSLFDKNALLRKGYQSKCQKQDEAVKCVNYDSKGAPAIKKFSGFTEEGYGFIHFENNEKSATLKEKVVYKNFKGLTLCSPQQGEQYDISVGPGEQKTILMQCHPEGYSMSSSTSSQISFSGKQLK